MKVIETNTRKIMPNTTVAIVDSFEDEDAVHSLSDVKAKGDNTGHTEPSICTVAKKKLIPPRSEAPVIVCSTEER